MEEAGNCHFADAITDACVNTKASCAVPVAARPNKPTSTTLIIASGEGHACVSASQLGNRENTPPPLEVNSIALLKMQLICKKTENATEL